MSSPPNASDPEVVNPAAHLIGRLFEVLAQRLDEALTPTTRGYVGDDEPRGGRDPHRVLGLPRDATPADVKRRVRDLARIFHPDVKGGNAEKMAEINDAAKAILAREAKAAR